MDTKATFLGTEYQIFKNEDCRFLYDNDINNLVRIYSFELEKLAKICRKVLKYIERKNGLEIDNNDIPSFILYMKDENQDILGKAQLFEYDYPYYCNLAIFYTFEDNTVRIKAQLDGDSVYEFYGDINALNYENEKKGLKRLQPEELGSWRTLGFRPMFFKNRVYLMLTGKYLPNVSKDGSLDLQSLSTILSRYINAFELMNGLTSKRVMKVHITQDAGILKCLASLEDNRVRITIVNKGSKVRISALENGQLFRKENTEIEFFKN